MNSNDNQGRGPNPRQATGADWLLAAAIGLVMACACVAWGCEPDVIFVAVSK